MAVDYKDIIGLEVGRLVVKDVESIEMNDKTKRRIVKYTCECSCGNTTTVERNSLRFGKTKSCGCYRLAQIRRAGKYKTGKQKKLVCETCGKDFPVPKCREEVAKYCSVVCANEGFKRENKTPHKHVGWEYKEWKELVLTRDSHTCILCGSKDKVVAHHLKPYANYEDEKFDIDNGVSLCEECHIKFHKKYGYIKFTQVDFIKWIKD